MTPAFGRACSPGALGGSVERSVELTFDDDLDPYRSISAIHDSVFKDERTRVSAHSVAVNTPLSGGDDPADLDFTSISGFGGLARFREALSSSRPLSSVPLTLRRRAGSRKITSVQDESRPWRLRRRPATSCPRQQDFSVEKPLEGQAFSGRTRQPEAFRPSSRETCSRFRTQSASFSAHPSPGPRLVLTIPTPIGPDSRRVAQR